VARPNLGDGYYQYDFKSVKAWAGQCAMIAVETVNAGTRSTLFKFTR
jgi:hypothetical protein